LESVDMRADVEHDTLAKLSKIFGRVIVERSGSNIEAYAAHTS